MAKMCYGVAAARQSNSQALHPPLDGAIKKFKGFDATLFVKMELVIYKKSHTFRYMVFFLP